MGRRRERIYERQHGSRDECTSSNLSPAPDPPTAREETIRGHSGHSGHSQRWRPSNARVMTDGQAIENNHDSETEIRSRSNRNGNEYHHHAGSRSSGNGRNNHPPNRHRHHAKTKVKAKKRHGLNILKYMFVANLLVASFNYFISQQSILDIATWGSNDQSRRKLAFRSKEGDPDDENTEIFLRTGQLPGSRNNNNKERPGRSYVNSPTTREKRSSTNQNSIARAGNSKKEEVSKKSQERKRNRRGIKAVNQMDEWPPFSSLIDKTNGQIAEGVDISAYLDFSIIGFPKTGTTSVHRHLSDLTNSLPKEHCDLVVNDTVKLMKDIYDDLIFVDNQLLRGIKCPQDVSSDWSMHNYARYFPRTKLIVGVRHPIFWFESLYNFRVSNVPWKTMPHTAHLTKGCQGGSQGVCAWRANFHAFLAKLGKTPMSSESEMKLLSQSTAQINPVKSSVGPVFIYELSQLSSDAFRRDLRYFLGLKKDIPPIPQVDTSGRFDHVSDVKRKTTQQKINICDDEHGAIRSALMKKARSSSIWIRDYFLESEDVFVSDRQYFENMIKSWMEDPCG